KRALSLGLTAAMISGLMVMGSSAASYADVTSEDNQEAIEVLQTVGIMVGDENGDFNPDQNVTRNEMAVIMSNLMEYNVASYKDTSPFTDVPSWAEPYVAACWTNGITAGYSDTIYGGNDTVTTAQAALMLMKALGYFQYASDFGSDWQLATTRQGNAIDLFVGVDSGVTQAMTRNDVAQLVLNTLEAGTVEASTDGSWSIGDIVINNNVTYNYITSNQAYATAIDDARSTSNNSDAQRSIVELGEQLYMGDLKLDGDTLDDFGRPSRTWSYEGRDIGTYAKKALLQQTYTVAVEGGEVYTDIGATASDYELTYTVDGVELSTSATEDEAAKLERRNDQDMYKTGTGVQTEVYVDNDKEETYIVVINTWLAEAAVDYRTSSEDIILDVFVGATDNGPKTVPDSYTVEVEDIPEIEDLVEGDLVLVRMADNEIVSIDTPDVVGDVAIDEYDADRDNANPETDYMLNSVTADGTEYPANVKTFWEAEFIYDHATEDLDDATYNLYLDYFGNVIGVEQVDGEARYVFVVGYDENSSHLARAIDSALVIFPDGTIDTIDVRDNELTDEEAAPLGVNDGDGSSNVNRWYTYSVNDSEVYTLESYVDDQIVSTWNDISGREDGVIDRDYSTVGDKDDASKAAVGNNASVFITVDADDDVTDAGSIVDVNGMVTGIREANIQLETYNDLANFDDHDNDEMVFVVPDGRYIQYAVVVGSSASNDDYVYLTSGTLNHGYNGGDYYWTYEGITKDGVVEFRSYTSEDQNDNQLAAHNLYKMDFDEDGYVTRNGAELMPETAYEDLNTAGYRADGYGLTEIDEVQELFANDLTFYYDVDVNSRFIHLADDCVFYVYASDDDEYVEYRSASSALNALGVNSNFTGTVAALVDSNGFAEVLILKDTYTGNDSINDNNDDDEIVGTNEGYRVSMTSRDEGVIYVNDRVDYGDSVRDMATEAISDIEDMGYTVYQGPVAQADGEYVIYAEAANGSDVTFTTATTSYELVTVATEIENTDVSGADQFWTKDGDEIVVTLSRPEGVVFDHDDYNATVENGTAVVVVSDDNTTMQLTITVTDASDDVVIEGVTPVEGD
ncbi:S-layer homology domain-containing protein, partial [Pseudoflavonifractor capillosus]|uniref:S-layer homology domain-containing protein n=1 Tax=Pseudoflavonifractor capillosus TaxID=106588 RepID=UPI001958E9EA